jgi:hypothetical protein
MVAAVSWPMGTKCQHSTRLVVAFWARANGPNQKGGFRRMSVRALNIEMWLCVRLVGLLRTESTRCVQQEVGRRAKVELTGRLVGESLIREK